jgi:hypothetical protein
MKRSQRRVLRGIGIGALAAVFEVDLTMLTDRTTLIDKGSSEVPACRVGSTATVTARVSGPDRRREHDLRIRAGVIP